MDGHRIKTRVIITPERITITATPLAPDVTPEELYKVEQELSASFAEHWPKVMQAMGAEVEITNIRLIKDHEPDQPEQTGEVS